MTSKEDIFKELQHILSDTFQIESSRILPQAKLYEDLELDSIDAIDLIVRIEDITKLRLKTENFKKVRTIQDVIDTISDLLNTQQTSQ